MPLHIRSVCEASKWTDSYLGQGPFAWMSSTRHGRRCMI
jgi:hypothetical protein